MGPGQGEEGGNGRPAELCSTPDRDVRFANRPEGTAAEGVGSPGSPQGSEPRHGAVSADAGGDRDRSASGCGASPCVLQQQESPRHFVPHLQWWG
jgi:hypothetical protein